MSPSPEKTGDVAVAVLVASVSSGVSLESLHSDGARATTRGSSGMGNDNGSSIIIPAAAVIIPGQNIVLGLRMFLVVNRVGGTAER